MENLKVLYNESDSIKGICSYKESDYYIEFHPENGEKHKFAGGRFYVIFDTLTITFIGHGTKQMYSLDAYTNSNMWDQDSTLILPSDYRLGNILLTGIPSDDDRISINLNPKFYYSKSRNILCIRITDAKTFLYVKISDCLFCGLTQDMLNEIILYDIDFI